jgi:predicted dehydrogenase
MTMARDLRVALVGAGRWARRAHLPAWQGVMGADLVAVADPDLPRAQALAARVGVPAYPSLAAVLKEEKVDVVDVASATESHVLVAQSAIEAGCHVLCEKPIALSAGAAARLRDLAQRRGVVDAVAFTFRHAPAVGRLRARLAAGSLGRIYHVQGFEQNSLYHDAHAPRTADWLRADRNVGALGEYGSHLVDLVRWLVADFVDVAADARTFVVSRALEGGGMAPSQLDDSTAFVARLEGGAQALMQASWVATGRPPGVELRIHGERGGLCLQLSEALPGGERLLEADVDEGVYRPVPASGLVSERPEDWPEAYISRLVSAFVARIQGDPTAIVAGFADGAASQEVLDAVMKASRSRRWEAVGTSETAPGEVRAGGLSPRG